MITQSTSDQWPALRAYVLPFAIFIVGTALESYLPDWLPFLYTLKIGSVLAVLCTHWRYYPAWSWRGMALGLFVGLVGGVIWIILCTWNVESFILPWLPEWMRPGPRTGGDPFTTPFFGSLFVPLRLIGLVIVVPWMEELFWRGFLNRYLIKEDWRSVPYGHFTPWSFAIVTLLFVAVHPEWTAALVWCAGINALLMKTRNLWSCVAAHAASNAVLGYYILAYQQWHLW